MAFSLNQLGQVSLVDDVDVAVRALKERGVAFVGDPH